MSLIETICEQIEGDDGIDYEQDSARIIDNYENASDEVKAIIDDIFISLTGWGMPNLIRISNGEEPQ